MGSIIKPLPEAVRHSIRSGVILFDLTRVVEELVFNSLDAGATKVLVYVGVSTCYVKVVDDGCGISRDGLVMLGERYVTSKFHQLDEGEDANRSFGFRGEALASISDVSLVEIVTKACGRANGYRKIMKGSKCLFMGIDDGMKDVGTTVVVRDLFYNQPVRRKYMHSSPKKVLQSVRKCVLQIALVHSKVSFKVVDTESEDELLQTRSSSSSLSLLMSDFGIQDCSVLQKVDVSDGILKLSGYISGPCDSSAIKVFQYVYINSRFVCKGPIHKLLNHLSTRFECLDPWKVQGASQRIMKNRSQANPTYIVNLSCPLSLYDLTFEPSKTYVEFKDWDPILTFIEKAIQQLWNRSIASRDCSSHSAKIYHKNDVWKEDDNNRYAEEDFLGADLFENSKFAMKRHDHQKHQYYNDFASFALEMSNKSPLCNSELDILHMNASEFKEQQADMVFGCQSDNSVQSWSGPLFQCVHIEPYVSDIHVLTSDEHLLPTKDDFLDSRCTARERYSDCEKDQTLSLEWQNESPKIEPGMENESAWSHQIFRDELELGRNSEKPFLRSCSSWRNLPLVSSKSERLEFPTGGFKTKRRRICLDEEFNFANEMFGIFPMTLQKDETSIAHQFPAHAVEVDVPVNSDTLPGCSAKSSSSRGKHFAKMELLESESGFLTESFSSDYHPFDSQWCSQTSDALFETASWAVKQLSDDRMREESAESGKRENYWCSACGEETECRFSHDTVLKSSSRDNCNKSGMSVQDCPDFGRGLCRFLQGHNLDDLSLEISGISFGETEWSLLDSFSKDNKNFNKYPSRRNQLRHQGWEQYNNPKGQHKRSHSAPPFYRKKQIFFSLNHHPVMQEREPLAGLVADDLSSPEENELKELYSQPDYVDKKVSSTRCSVKNGPDSVLKSGEMQKSENFDHSQVHVAPDSPIEGLMPKEMQESVDYGTKWRNGCQQISVEWCCQSLKGSNRSSNIGREQDILDIYSGLLHLAGNLLVPESIHKNSLKEAKVLHQVDKKFIPVVAGGTLAIIDQHAADERIRLEELRQKVLSGESKKVTYLDAEQELILPEAGNQLLHNYAEQIRDWGWICSIQAQNSGTFKKDLNILHQQQTLVTLIAVPCILGVNLSDRDLLEFLEQLADTAGSLTMPPAVLRVLNFKACRGAIMFGDSLLPSECALIVEELKQTSLCFQCAHGRPTTAPLVDLEALHGQIAKLGVLDSGSDELWHGLCRQEISLERAADRLRAARDMCS